MINAFDLPKDPALNGFVFFVNGVPIAVKSLVTPSNPTVNSDDTQGYFVGSIWVNSSTREIFICSDNSTGAAIWNSFYRTHNEGNYSTASGTNTYTVTLPCPIGTYTNGMTLAIYVPNGNTGASTLNVDGKGAKNIYKNGIDLVEGDIAPNSLNIFSYNIVNDRFDLVAASANENLIKLDPFLIIGS